MQSSLHYPAKCHLSAALRAFRRVVPLPPNAYVSSHPTSSLQCSISSQVLVETAGITACPFITGLAAFLVSPHSWAALVLRLARNSPLQISGKTSTTPKRHSSC